MYVIGTAGHVDHGKSTLVQALTGIDPDRLQEEKARGMTIDLGFAWLTLPGGEEVSIVDVPGHERFIKNMLAGVGGIDLALLVVAADEGVMPQTREHLAILDLLGVQAGVVAVTKSDLVEQDWLELVQAEIQETLAGTTLAGAPLVPVSAYTRAGLDALLQTIETTLAATPAKRDIGRPRLAIDRAFTINGFGTVVTGTLIDGALRLGQEVEIAPAGLRSRVRGLQTHRSTVETAQPGSRVAVNLPGIGTDQLHRGLVLTAAGWLAPTNAVDVRIQAVAELPRPLRHNISVTFHTGAAEVNAKLRLLDRDELPPGESGWAQVRLAQPLAAVKGDSFVVRSPNATLGGGRIVATGAKRHRRHHAPTLATLENLSQGSPEEAVFTLIERLQPAGIISLARQSELGEAGVRAAVAALLESGRLMRVGGDEGDSTALFFTAPGFHALTEAAAAAVSTYLRDHSLRGGIGREELRGRLSLQARPFTAVVARWLADGTFVEAGATLRLPGHEVRLTALQEREAGAFIRELEESPYSPQATAWPAPELLAYLAEQNRIVPVAEGIVFASAAYQKMVARVREHLEREGTVTLAQVRDLFGTSRKYAQALLEHLDERRITRRVGDERVLR